MSTKRKGSNYYKDSSSDDSSDSHKVDFVSIHDDSSEEEEKPVKKKIKNRKIVDSESDTTTSSEEDSDSSDSDFDSDKACSSKRLFSCKKSDSTSSSSKTSLDQKSTTSPVSTDLFSLSDNESSDELNSSINNNNNTRSVEELQADNILLKKQLLKEKSAREKLEQEIKELRGKYEKSSSGPRKSRLKSVCEGRKTGGRMSQHKQLNEPWDAKHSEYLSAVSKITKVLVNNKRMWKCSLCEHNYSRKEKAMRHIANIHFDRQFPCSSCDKIFSGQANLRVHIKQFHSGKNNKFTEDVPSDLKVLELKSEDNEVICRSFEEKDRDFLYDHWICRYLPNVTSTEPPPHLFASGFTHKTDKTALKQNVNRIKRDSKTVDHTENNKKKKARNGCESYKKMKNLGFDLSSSSVISCGIISRGEKTADEVKPVVRKLVCATYNRNHLDSLNILNKAAVHHLRDTLMDYIKEGQSQRTMWNNWAKENINVLVLEAINTNITKTIGATVNDIIDHIERTRLVGATFLQPDIETYLQNAVQDKSILSVDGQFKINI